MSAAVPYLQKLRKPQLAELAEITDLRNHEDYNKPELVLALDQHLQANRSIFATDKRLANYYSRLATRSRGVSSPAKRDLKQEVTPSSDGVGVTRRRTTRLKEESVPTPRPRHRAAPLPPSPAIVTDAIDRQSAEIRRSISEAWTGSGVEERSSALRATLSSAKAIQVIALLLEAASLIYELLPLRYLTTIPAVRALHTPPYPIKVPDLFVLVDGVFWAPISLWLLTSLVLPLLAAYFFNFRLNSASRGKGGGGASSFDPLSFNLVKALVSYFVYRREFDFFGTFVFATMHKVDMAVPGQWRGTVAGAVIGIVGTLYEEILRRG
ncbi:hypothetical protein P168DRAFT_289860 [Aspergillus campestris IBT 28561]|uniref:Uncharacterized protein n=1 Tax=Aspergillus campestris (strain IBT 28561) TaxID=1392248 RepID=A0A2I1D576_ASPC2|nr:uncharacterized protein P168DRAFT_289860 [Aspergillus campestris IBT 28561]PKY05031.1 hypothetical protein P168DRAFT_289860 [Aspergillus campestris IBT 28561]